MKIVFLGTNGWYDTKTGNTVSALIETKSEYIILDAGIGFYKINRHINKGLPIYLFLSHYHLDHISGLHTLAKFDFPQGIDVFGPKGLNNMFARIIRRPYSMPLNLLKTKIRLNELSDKKIFPLKFTAARLKHASTCFGYRFFLEEKVLSYATDTGICPNLFLLAKDADLVISECSLLPGEENTDWPHLNPEQAALAAKESGTKKLFLSHFDAAKYLDFENRKEALISARRIFRQTFLAKDDLTVDL